MSEKNIKDFIHLYLGCDCTTPGWGKAIIKGIDYTDKKEPIIVRFNTPALHGGYRADKFPYDEIKPILRPLSDMIKEEKNELNPVEFNSFELTRVLLSKHFDLFGLIEAGLAIDATTFK